MSESFLLELVVSLLSMHNQESCGRQKFPSRALFYDQWVQLVPKFLSTWSHLRTWICGKNGGARSVARASPGSPGISLGSTIEMELTIATIVFSWR